MTLQQTHQKKIKNLTFSWNDIVECYEHDNVWLKIKKNDMNR